MHLFWALFTAKPLEGQPLSDSNKGPKVLWEVRLAWSKRREGKWLPKQVSTSAWRAGSAHKQPLSKARPRWKR
ncbi:neuraminidase-like domain-containing protein [Chondromyces crocatus]|uniref:neuraminidase-like domain-containing protein n=1 Tax=Chondromyces crocatus TaxID=52 RepID=UPI00147050DD